MSTLLALSAAGALVGLSMAHQASPLKGFRLSDLPYDMHELVYYGLTQDLGMSISEAEWLLAVDPPLHIEMRSMDDLWAEIRRNFRGEDQRGRPVDVWLEGHWDYRGPPHVEQLRRLLCLLLPDPIERQTPERIAARLLASDAAPRWAKDPSPRVWEDRGRDADIVVGLQARPQPRPAARGMTYEGAFNLPPALFAGEAFVDGRHRIFAARLAGLSHFPVVDLMGLQAD